ncbi:hypothetical protein PoMZ_04204 [Pyricularia oryzae]|uniref:Uncharacterized protein n=1 Tax=Pyricularia oryzae TaxID=318829 RepID=A0A4P7N9P4_PYROR|nr:hypothetical protein PoMZ_04204 [Pyricularia oryzae]
MANERIVITMMRDFSGKLRDQTMKNGRMPNPQSVRPLMTEPQYVKTRSTFWGRHWYGSRGEISQKTATAQTWPDLIEIRKRKKPTDISTP